MITTTWTEPSAPDVGRGSTGVRTAGWMTRLAPAPLRGTGLPVAGCGTTGRAATATAATGAGFAGIAPVVTRPRVRQDGAGRFPAATYLPQHDATTLGIASPGRPQS